ncbi:MAG: branched-chain amino acid transaminase [Deltaproteobacteria bacterium]|nr:branched-chain amino acid transaminase [Deltaproteobacteria bacterium]MBI3296170.1 branched-chain amino acid transaminase [Deltaproteobacteria bacterium]
MDGKTVPYASAQIHVLSHSLHYGSAAFEGMRAYRLTSGKTGIFRAKEHYERFFNSIRVLGYHTRWTTEQLVEATRALITVNGFQQCYVRPIAFIDDAVRGLRLPKEPKASVTIATWDWGKYMGDDGHKNGVRVGVSTLRRPDVATSLPWAKLSGNYLVSVLSRLEATQNGFDEAILLDPNGYVAEGSGENIFVVKNRIISTPPTAHILPGITRDSVIQIARDLGYTVREENIIRNQLYLADEVFFSGTAVEVTPIREIDHRPIGASKPGPVCKTISEAFFSAVHGDSPRYSAWVTSV